MRAQFALDRMAHTRRPDSENARWQIAPAWLAGVFRGPETRRDASRIFHLTSLGRGCLDRENGPHRGFARNHILHLAPRDLGRWLAQDPAPGTTAERQRTSRRRARTARHG